MGYPKRKELYQAHENVRHRPLIAYVTSVRQNVSSKMASDAITTIIEQINQIPQDKNKIDFLIISNGGDPIVALRIITILRERFKHISVIVP
jgi:ATP-dependent protease ClpP protease subunit